MFRLSWRLRENAGWIRFVGSKARIVPSPNCLESASACGYSNSQIGERTTERMGSGCRLQDRRYRLKTTRDDIRAGIRTGS